MVRVIVWLALVGYYTILCRADRVHDNRYVYRYICSQVWATVGDIGDFHRALFSRDSLNIIAGCIPVYCVARQCDECLHRCFYQQSTHTNIRQLPVWSVACANIGVLAVPMLITGGLALCSSDTVIKTTSRVFIMSLPFTWVAKRMLKLLTGDFCLRPRNQYFSRYKRMCGGFPSGHMFEAVYMATLFGLQWGYRWGVSLSFGAVFLGVNFIVCNRHYISQLVAGAALGLIYGCAAHKLIQKKISWQVYTREDALGISYAF